ncbi:MAG: PD-(D/E)XK nuclease family protein [Candidatus Pacebacteria bacterium]|nr:PD-(D/E)XK nuclease family protein [Candidatus Paceibacterota bacterium]
MPLDKFSAIWVSHSSISDFLQCPRAYFLKNVYKSPKNGRKIAVMSPPLALGQVVHEVVESLSSLPVDRRFDVPLLDRFEQLWNSVSGKRGGFSSQKTEELYKSRGRMMINRVTTHPGPIKEKAVKLNMDLPQFWLSEEDNIILCGKLDWLQYLEDSDSIRIIDFKTSRSQEHSESLQLPIYHLLAHYCQKRMVAGVSYWYLELSDVLVECPLQDLQESQEKVLKIAKKIKTARALEKFGCPQGEKGCRVCQPFEAVIRGEAEFVGTDENRRDVFVLTRTDFGSLGDDRDDGVVL